MISGKLNLAALKHVVIEKKGKDDKMIKGLFIPIEANNLFASEKENGGIYLDLVCFEMKEKKDYATHIVKQSFSKKELEEMGDAAKELPILGNLNTEVGNKETNNNAAGKGVTLGAEDDVPF